MASSFKFTLPDELLQEAETLARDELAQREREAAMVKSVREQDEAKKRASDEALAIADALSKAKIRAEEEARQKIQRDAEDVLLKAEQERLKKIQADAAERARTEAEREAKAEAIRQAEVIACEEVAAKQKSLASKLAREEQDRTRRAAEAKQLAAGNLAALPPPLPINASTATPIPASPWGGASMPAQSQPTKATAPAISSAFKSTLAAPDPQPEIAPAKPKTQVLGAAFARPKEHRS